MSSPYLTVNKTYQIQSESFSKELCTQYPYGSVFLVLELTKQDLVRQKKLKVTLYRVMSIITGEEVLLPTNEIGTTFAVKDKNRVEPPVLRCVLRNIR